MALASIDTNVRRHVSPPLIVVKSAKMDTMVPHVYHVQLSKTKSVRDPAPVLTVIDLCVRLRPNV